jgi:hypothetical protein
VVRQVFEGRGRDGCASGALTRASRARWAMGDGQ